MKRVEDEEENERQKVIEYLNNEVKGWESDEKAMRVWFKEMSGQINDYEWQNRYLFWKNLIINVAQHLNTFIINPHRLKFIWFRRAPPNNISPLCLDLVLVEMCKNGELIPFSDLINPKSPPLSLFLRKLLRFIVTPITHHHSDSFIISSLLKEKGIQVMKVLSETHWTPSCVITLNKFINICKGSKEEESALLSHLTLSGKAKYFSIQNNDVIEGVKIAISPKANCNITSLDYDVLHLLSTVEKLEHQFNVMDSRWKKFKSLALASLKCGERKVALRYVREVKLASQGKDKCESLLNQVEDVLRLIADAESSKQVSEAILIGARAIKENRISVEEVEEALEELNESIASQKQLDKVLESSLSYDDEEFEDELRKLELDINKIEEPIQDEDISNSLSALKLKDDDEAAQDKNVSNVKMLPTPLIS